MAEMTPLQIMSQEWHNIGTTWTKNEDFDRDGYFGINSLWDPKELYHPVPKERGKMRWWGKKIDQFQYDEIEGQVEGSISRYNHPQYRKVHTGMTLVTIQLLAKSKIPERPTREDLILNS